MGEEQDLDPDPLVRVMDLRIRIRTKMSRIRNETLIVHTRWYLARPLSYLAFMNTRTHQVRISCAVLLYVVLPSASFKKQEVLAKNYQQQSYRWLHECPVAGGGHYGDAAHQHLPDHHRLHWGVPGGPGNQAPCSNQAQA